MAQVAFPALSDHIVSAAPRSGTCQYKTGTAAPGSIKKAHRNPPGEWQIEEEEAISRMKTEELDRLVAAGTIREIDRESVRFIVRRIVQPSERPDDPSPENADRSG